MPHATGKTVPAVVVPLPPHEVPPLARRKLCALLALPPALPSVFLVAGLDMNFLGVRASPTSVLRRRSMVILRCPLLSAFCCRAVSKEVDAVSSFIKLLR